MTDQNASNSRTTRRRFLQTAAAAATAAGVAMPMIIPRSALAAPGKPGANERVTVGAIGVGNRAKLLLQQLPEGGQIVALSDCNLPRAEEFKASKKADWPVIQDYRKLLERKDIDAVIVGTGEFQRVLPCIHAVQAGKDVYAEKPLTLYIKEGRVLVDGGATNPLPFDRVRGGADIVIAVDVAGPPAQAKSEIPNALETYLATILVMAETIIEEKLRHGGPDIILRPNVGVFRTLDFLRVSAILRAAEPVKTELREKLAKLV